MAKTTKQTVKQTEVFKEKYVNTPPGEITVSSSFYYDEMKLDQDLMAKYKDYDKMDEEVIEVSSALDVYADNAVAGGNNLEKEYLVVLGKANPQAQKIIDDLDKTEIKDVIWNIARSTMKYGNWYVEMVVKDDKLVRFKELPVTAMRLNKDEYGRLKNIVQKSTDGSTKKDIPIDIWKCVHFSMNRPYTYGSSTLGRIRRLARQLRMCEDALVMARLSKASRKIIYKVDVTGMNGSEAALYVKKWKANMRKKRVMNPITGEMIEDYNPLRDEEDIFLPVRQNSSTDVTPLEGDANISDIADINFLQNRLFAGLKLPKAYLGFEGDTHNRNVITALDIQFARQVRRLQKVLEKGLRHIYDVAFILGGFNPDEVDYKIIFPTISTIDALTEWQVNQTKLMTAQLLLGMGISLPDEWVLGTLLGLPKSEVETISAYTKKTIKEQEVLDAKQKEEDQQNMLMQQAAAQGTLPPPTAPTPSGLAAPEDYQLTPDDTANINSVDNIPQGGQDYTTLSPEDQAKIDSVDTPEYKLSPDDIKKLNMENSATNNLLMHLLHSNNRLQDLVEDTRLLVTWKLDYEQAQNQIDKLKNEINKK